MTIAEHHGGRGRLEQGRGRGGARAEQAGKARKGAIAALESALEEKS